MRSKRFVATLVLVVAFIVCIAPYQLGVIAGWAAFQPGRAQHENPQSGPVIRTDKREYLAKEVIAISGEGFSPFERVMLRVAHAGGTTEAGMGHDPWFVEADANGTFHAGWSVNNHDSAGVNFILEAVSSTGLSARASFVRKAGMTTDQLSYRRGERARITMEGFNANELVTLKLDGGSQTEPPLTVVSDNNGRLTAELQLPGENSGTGVLTVTAVSRESSLTASLDIPFNFFTIADQECRRVLNLGCPNDQPGQKDMTQMGRDESDPNYYKLFWSWDETAGWTGSGNTGYACALFDGNADGIIDLAACGQITNPGGNPNLVAQTAASPQFWKCPGNSKPDRCLGAQAVPFGPNDIQAGVASFATVNTSGDLKTATDPFAGGTNFPYDSTLQLNISKSFLQTALNSLNLTKVGVQHLVNVCSYPSGVTSDAGDCILSPGGGYLVIKKEVTVGDQISDFSFTVQPVPAGQQSTYTITGAGQTKPIGLTIGTGTGSVTETVLSNWKLVDAFCTTQNGDPTGNKNSNPFTGVTGITINSGEVTTCTFRNAQLMPHIKVVKSLDHFDDTDKSGTITRGDTLYYKFEVTNDGGTALSSISVTDATFSLAVNCGGITSLAPGASMNCTTAGHVVTLQEADNAKVVNTVNVSGKPPLGADVTASNTLTTPVRQNPQIQVVKSLDHYDDADKSGMITRGDTLYYKFVVTNSGNVTLSSISVTDATFSLTTNCPAGTSLAPGVSITCATTTGHVVTLEEINAGKSVNTVNVSSKSPAGADATGTNTLTTPVAQNPQIQVVKSLDHYDDTDTSGTITRGDTLYYKFVVTNSGNVTLSSIGVTDVTFALTNNCPVGTSLAPNASITCTTTTGHVVTVQEADAAKVVNTVNVSGKPPAGPDATAANTLTTPVAQNPHIQVVKLLDHYDDSDKSGTITRGDTLYYKFVVTNSGNVTLDSINVIDATFSLAVDCGAITLLAPGASMTCTTQAGHTVSLPEADTAKVVNTVRVSGKSATGSETTGSDTLTTPVVQNAQIQVVKSVDHYDDSDKSGTITRGDTLYYKFVVTNSGNVTLSSISVTDATFSLAVNCGGITSLAPGASMTCTTTTGHVVTTAESDAGAVVNIVNVSGKSPAGADTTASNTLRTPVAQNRHLTFELKITNDGNVTVPNVSPGDLSGLVWVCTPVPPTTLAPAGSMACIASKVPD